jgi:riboflavin synthase
MFAGIVKGVGRVLEQRDKGGDRVLTIALAGIDLGVIGPGDSIAVNGVCLTVTTCNTLQFTADVSAETLAVTTLGRLAPNDAVNLEASLRLGDRVDGHLVYGHVDGVGRVVAVSEDARSMRLEIEHPAQLARYIAVKGSVAVDGTSLTVNGVGGNRLAVNIVPHTRDLTVISGYAPGTPVNIEVDIIARYLERLAQHEEPAVSHEMLKRHGFVSHE